MDSVRLDMRIIVFLIATTALATMIFGALPALRYSRADALAALRGGTSAGIRDRHRLRGAVVTAEIALALVLLIGAGLLTRSFSRLVSNDLGFVADERVYLQVFVWDRNPTPEQRVRQILELRDQLLAVPAVTAVAAVSALPFNPHAITAAGSLSLDDRPPLPGEQQPRVYTTVATPEYFRTMGIPLIRGRAFTAADRFGTPLVAVVNETFARTHFPGEDPVGRRVTIGVMGPAESREIIGVTGDVRPTGFDAAPRPELFVPHAQHGTGSMTFVVRAGRNAGAALPSLRARVWDVDPNQSVYADGSLASLIGATIEQRRYYLVIVGLLSAFAFGLTIVGVYGLISFWTRLRVREIGVRVAVGASRADIVRMVVLHALRLAAPGIVLGIAGALAFSRTLRHMLYDTSAAEPVTYAYIAALMLAVAAAAAYVPARRALAQHPLRALQSE
jgi:putative ABC transport system permease protein